MCGSEYDNQSHGGKRLRPMQWKDFQEGASEQAYLCLLFVRYGLSDGLTIKSRGCRSAGFKYQRCVWIIVQSLLWNDNSDKDRI